jgi:benzoate membrane transport protein
VPILRDFSVSTVTAGFVACLVGLTSGIALVFEAAQKLGADDAQVTSWVWALCLGMAVLIIVPSLRWKVPVMMAFSAPGAAILATLPPGSFTLGEAVGAFMVCGVVTAAVGYSGLFEQIMNRIPLALVSGLLAGVLARFVLGGFADGTTAPGLVAVTTVVYVALRRWAPRYAVIGVLVAGVAVSLLSGSLRTDELRWSLARPVFVAPSLSFAAMIGIALPLFIVTMAGQNLPGVAVIRSTDYRMPLSKVIGTAGAASVVMAPFGGYSYNLSAITAAICMEPAAHEDPSRRYTAALANGGFYLIAGLFGTSITGALRAFPPQLVHIVAALALLPAIANGLFAMTADSRHRDAAVLTFVVTLSGVTVARIGSPLWGVVAGSVAIGISSIRTRQGRATGRPAS